MLYKYFRLLAVFFLSFSAFAIYKIDNKNFPRLNLLPLIRNHTRCKRN